MLNSSRSGADNSFSMANPERSWGQKTIAGAEILGAGASFLKMIQAFVSAGFSPSVAIWGGLGLVLGIDGKNRWSKK